MHRWRAAFVAWMVARFGVSRWRDHTIDRDYVREQSKAFRAGYRAGLRVARGDGG